MLIEVPLLKFIRLPHTLSHIAPQGAQDTLLRRDEQTRGSSVVSGMCVSRNCRATVQQQTCCLHKLSGDILPAPFCKSGVNEGFKGSKRLTWVNTGAGRLLLSEHTQEYETTLVIFLMHFRLFVLATKLLIVRNKRLNCNNCLNMRNISVEFQLFDALGRR